MDAVYIVGTGSRHNNAELRYSLRSLAQYVSDIDRLVVVGRVPGWIREAQLLRCEDLTTNKERNIMVKVLRACGVASAQFLHLHDDHFALAPQLAQVPAWGWGGLEELSRRIRPGNSYRRAVQNTLETLTKRGHTTYHFDIHTPIVYDRQLFQEVMAAYDWSVAGGYLVKSLYCNTLGIAPISLVDVKIDKPFPLAEVVPMLQGRPWWSVGDRGMEGPVRVLLPTLYAKKSWWEA